MITLSSAGCPQCQMSQFYIHYGISVKGDPYGFHSRKPWAWVWCVVLGLHFCIRLWFGSQHWELGTEFAGVGHLSGSVGDPSQDVGHA